MMTTKVEIVKRLREEVASGRSGLETLPPSVMNLPDSGMFMLAFVGILNLMDEAANALAASEPEPAPADGLVDDLVKRLKEPRLGIHEDGTEELKTWEQLWQQCQEAATALQSTRAEVLEEGCTPVDIRVLREANVDLATENQKLRQALRFYANGDHWICEGKARSVWDTCSGEPQNWFWRENENDDAEGVEDGQIAKMALRGDPIDWEGEEPNAAEGEAEYAIRSRGE